MNLKRLPSHCIAAPIILLLIIITGCSRPAQELNVGNPTADITAIDTVLDGFHTAASKADGPTYFAFGRARPAFFA